VTYTGHLLRQFGYSIRKARKVLTSPDPNYREKVELLLNTLQTLKPGELFFFVDELGPLRVKNVGGETLSIAAPGIHSVQFAGILDQGGVAFDDFTFNSVVPVGEVPGPIVGAGLPGLVAACGGLLAWRRRRKRLLIRSAAPAERLMRAPQACPSPRRLFHKTSSANGFRVFAQSSGGRLWRARVSAESILDRAPLPYRQPSAAILANTWPRKPPF
jgi:hypothetical protein